MHQGREQLVMETFVQLADTLAKDYDVADFLQLLVVRCSQILQVETAGVLLEASDGRLQLVAATSDKMMALWDLEVRTGEGPCIEAYRRVEQVVAEDLREQEGRWPETAPKAVEIGLLAVCAFPLRLRGDCIGALNLYRADAGAFEGDDVRLAQAFADVAAIGILQERRVAGAEKRAQQLQGALDSRVLIERASGILVERYGVDFQQAFDAIRHHARSSNRKLRDVCAEIVEGGDPVKP